MRRVLRASAAALLAVFAMFPAGASAATPATITGKVVNGTTNEPIAGIQVKLSQANTQTGQGNDGIDKTTTDAKGAFTFTGVEGGSPWMYDVMVTYKNTPYYSKALTPKPGEKVNVTLDAYDTSSSSKDISTQSWVVYLDKDPSSGQLAVEQDVTFQNTGKTSYTGTPMGQGAGALSVTLPVAQGVDPNAIQVLGIFEQAAGGVVSGQYGSTAPLLPGSSQGTLRYVTTPPVTLSFPAQFPTKTFTLYVAPGITADTTGLTPGGTQSIPGGGPSPSPVDYSSYVATNLPLGQSVSAKVSMTGGSGPPTLAIVLIAVAGLAALFLVVVRLRSRPEPVPAGRRKPVQQRAGSRAPRQRQPSPAEHHAPDGDEVEADLLVAEIAALDLSFEQGLIQEDQYRALRSARKGELKRLRGGRT